MNVVQFIEGLNLMVTELSLITIIIIGLLFFGWSVFVYERWKKGEFDKVGLSYIWSIITLICSVVTALATIPIIDHWVTYGTKYYWLCALASAISLTAGLTTAYLAWRAWPK